MFSSLAQFYSVTCNSIQNFYDHFGLAQRFKPGIAPFSLLRNKKRIKKGGKKGNKLKERLKKKKEKECALITRY